MSDSPLSVGNFVVIIIDHITIIFDCAVHSAELFRASIVYHVGLHMTTLMLSHIDKLCAAYNNIIIFVFTTRLQASGEHTYSHWQLFAIGSHPSPQNYNSISILQDDEDSNLFLPFGAGTSFSCSAQVATIFF